MHHNRSKGFTLIELLIALTVFSVFMGSLLYMFKSSSDSFKMTSWKQQKTAQAQIFWSHLKKHIEEATDLLSVDPAGQKPNITTVLRPLFINNNPSCLTGNIITWNVSHIEFNHAANSHSDSSDTLILIRDNSSLFLELNGKKITKITDVDKIEFKITSVVLAGKNEEESLKIGEDGNAVGSIISISITLKPPIGYAAQDLRIVQNHKFRVNVQANAVASP